MDVLEKAYPSKYIVGILDILRFNHNIIKLVGTAGLKSQLYPADYDFVSKIDNKLSTEKSFLEFQRILNNIDSQNNLYFIEFKFQLKNDEKHKIFKIDDFTKEIFFKYFNSNLEYCKIDLILNEKGHFKEVSCVYFFSDKEIDRDEYIKGLLKENVDYYKEGNYYKSLKRFMSVLKNQNPPDKNLIVLITKFFNSNVGKLYQIKNKIDASIIFMNRYDNDKDNIKIFDGKLIKMFIKNIGLKDMPAFKLPELSNAYGEIINREALEFYNKYKLKSGVIPPYNTIK